MTRNEDQPPVDENSKTPDEVDDGLAFAYGEDSDSSNAPSVLDRIGEVTGSKPKISLRDGDPARPSPMLKPLGPEDSREAGKYVIQGELGRGGVGAVHKGHDQDLGRDVAMKFLHNKYKDDPAILHRFVEEAQIGGQLQHPGIVPVYDLGMVKGKPFFAMKLVKGQTLAKKLSDRESPATDRRSFLAIFEDVCQTMAYAHVRGVVHRDLKPANIMIGSFGEVQVVDWGMGKVMQSGGVADEKLAAERQARVSVIETVRSSDHGSKSIVGSVMGTPAYMPPEQARGDVDHMDERSDVFALGAILCEVLTGQPPYVGEPDELIGMAAIAKLDDAYARLEGCGGEKEMVELATLCLMPAPAARPKSAEVVAKAVHAHLAAVESRVHEARVEAAEAKVRATSLKRMQKLGISLTAVIAAGLLLSLWFWRAADTAAKNEAVARAAAVASAKEALENEQLAVEQTEIAERELARALEIKNLITEMLQSVNPEHAKTADITLLKGILDTTSKRLTDGAIEDELVAAELHALTGSVYLSIGLQSEAELHLPVAIKLRKRVLGEEHPDTLLSVASLTSLYIGQGRYAEAMTLLLQAEEISKRVLGEEHPTTLACMSNLANSYWQQGRYAEAERLYLRTLENRRVLGEKHPTTLASMINLGSLYRDQHRYAEAETLMLEALEIHKRMLGAEHPSTLASMSNLADLYQAQGRYDEAEPLYLQSLEIQKRVLGEEHPRTLACMTNLGVLYRNQQRFAEAETLMLQTLEIVQRVLGAEHPGALQNLSNVAILYHAQGRYAEAEPLMLQAIEIQERVLGAEHPARLGMLSNLGSLYNSMELFDDAAQMFEISLPITRRVLGPQHPGTGYAMKGLVTAYVEMDQLEDALPLHRERVELLVAAANQPNATASVLTSAAVALLAEEFEATLDPERALVFARRACAVADANGSGAAWFHLANLALAQHLTGDHSTALETVRRAFARVPDGLNARALEKLSEDLADIEAAAEKEMR
jgi:serine/threonine protein kinase/tetratricopeptide (TPR) repeat protein